MRLIEHFFRILAPDECLVCKKEGSVLCPECRQVQLIPIPSRCYRCYKQTNNYTTCPVCRDKSMLNSVYVRTQYNMVAKKVVHTLKFNFTRSSAELIAHELSALLPVMPADTIIVHTPAASTHIRQRGFDQSALIARELSHLTGLPHVHALARLGQQRQVGADRFVRRVQMQNAFRPLSIPVIGGTHILLVDDVLTTGSTLEAAALCLYRAGAKSISAITFAQAS